MESANFMINGKSICISGDVIERIAVEPDGSRNLGVYQQGNESVLTVRINLDEAKRAEVNVWKQRAQQAAASGDETESRRCRGIARGLEETVIGRIPHKSYD